MRRILAFAFALASATGASAQVVQDRYGPPRTAPAAAEPLVLAALSAPSAIAPYQGPLLSWARKRQAEPAVASLRTPTLPMIAILPAPRPPEPVAAPGPQGAAIPRPDSLYAPPAQTPPRKMIGPEVARPSAATQAQAAPEPAAQPARPPPAATPAPKQVAALAAPATPRAVGATPRFYSLHREYGLTPDAIPEPPTKQGYVLIGPPDDAKPAADDGDDRKPPTDRGTF